MAATSGDDKKEPQLELPSLRLPRLGRRRGSPQPGPAADATVAVAAERETEPTVVVEPETGPEPAPVPVRGDHEATRRLAAPRTRPAVAGPVAAALTGLVVGVGAAAATYAAMAACEAVRGVSTCGGGPGFLVLVAIVALMVLAGALLLRTLGVSGSVSTSFLAVGIVTVLAMLLLLDVILSPWMFLVVPVLSASAYLLSFWVTTRFENEDVGRRDWR